MAKLAYKDFHKDVHPQVEFIHEYVARIRDKNNAILKSANEAIDYKFSDMHKDSVRDKYKKVVLAEVKKQTGHIKITGIKNKKLEDRLKQNLGLITEEQIEKILDKAGSDYQPEHLGDQFQRSISNFSQAHYGGIAQEYSLSKEGKEHLVKYMNLTGKVIADALTPDQLSRLMTIHGVKKGVIPNEELPLEARVVKKPEKEPEEETKKAA